VRIWVDADAAPRAVKDVVARAAARVEVRCTLVANRRLDTPVHNPWVSAERVAGGPDEADDFIAREAAPGDLAITSDIPLAARLVEKGVAVVDPRGAEYDAESVRERLSVRDFMEGLRGAGDDTGGPPGFGARDKREFAATLDRVLTVLLRRAAGAE
jgi:uncharacterized protein YaiI (UPF0178 family)